MAINWPTSMPFDEIEIIDQSGFVETIPEVDVNTVPEYPIAFIPLISGYGYKEDEKLVYLDSSSIKKYGNPDYYKYGLSLYLANQFIDGGGHVLGLRMRAKDAMNSHVGLVAKLKVENKALLYTDDSGEEVKYYPYYKKVDGSEEPKYFEGIIYTHAYTDESGIHEATVHIDPEAKIMTGEDEEVLISEIYKIDEETFDILSVDNSEKLYSLLTRETLSSKLETAYWPSTYFSEQIKEEDKICNKENLKKALDSYKPDGTIVIPMVEGTQDVDFDNITEGTTYILPLFTFLSKPSGSNSYSFTLESDTSMESQAISQSAPQRFYKIQFYDGNTKLENTMSFSLDDFIYGDQSMYISDVIADHATNIDVIIAGEEENTNINIYRSILERYVTGENLINRDATDPREIDILLGSSRGDGYYNFELDQDSINFSLPVRLSYGSLGSFESKDSTVRDFAIKEALIDAYTGITNDLIYDEVRYPFTFVLPSVSDVDVYDAIVSLCNHRRSSVAPLYIPQSTTYSESRVKRTNIYDEYNSDKIFFHVESALVRDPYTHKRIRMPAIYFNAKAIPRLITSKGYGAPLAGNNYYWDGFIAGTMLPQSTNEDEQIKNHNVGINTMVEDGQGKAYAVEQITTQLKLTSLSEINNAITLRIMCNIALSIAKNTHWTTITDEEVANYKATVESKIGNFLKGAYKSMQVVTQRESVNGAGRNRLRCIIQVQFPDLLKGVSYSIYIL